MLHLVIFTLIAIGVSSHDGRPITTCCDGYQDPQAARNGTCRQVTYHVQQMYQACPPKGAVIEVDNPDGSNSMRSRISELEGKLTLLENLYKDMISLLLKNATKDQESPSMVAFSVTRSSKLDPARYRTNVVWQHVITDVGGAWDQTVGQFRAPVDGLYAFHLTAANYAINSRSLNLYLVKNGVDVTTAHGTGRFAAEGSTHVVLNMAKADTVLVQMVAGGSLYADINLRPVFTGYLIAAKP